MSAISNSARLLAATAIYLASAPAMAQDNGLESSDSTPISNPDGTTIVGTKKGVFSFGPALKLDNAGTIRGNGTGGNQTNPGAGIVVAGGAASIMNSGTISGARFGITTALYVDPVTSEVSGRALGSSVNNSGSIIGDNDDGVRLIGGGIVTNSGYIAGRVGTGADGVSMFNFGDQDLTGVTRIGTVSNELSGIIEGARFGVILSGGGTVTNAGTINGAGGAVIIQALDAGKLGTVINSGTINGTVQFNQLDSATVDNRGLISSGSGKAITTTSPGGALAVVNRTTGSISGSTTGIFSEGTSLLVDNAGTIRGNGTSASFSTPGGGVVITGGPGAITNSGTISGARFGITTAYFTDPDTSEASGRAIGSTVTNSGSIVGDNDDGVRLIGGGSVTNSGYIAGRVTAAADGVSMFGYDDQDTSAVPRIGTVNNLAGGTIEGARFGVILSGGGSISNAGTINGGTGGAILIQALDTGKLGSVTNTGVISGSIRFIELAGGTLDNSGTITGDVELGAGDDTLVLRTGSSVIGTVYGGTGIDNAVLIGTSAEPLLAQQVAAIAEFESLKAQQGYWTAASRVGSVAGVTIDAGATLELRQVILPNNSVASALDTGTLLINGRLVVDFGSDYDYSGSFSGTGNFIKRGAGTFSILGDYSFAGSTTIEGGRVRIAGQIAPSTVINLAQGTLDISGTSQTIAQLSGAAGTSVNVQGGALTVNQSSDTLFAGTITGNGTFSKQGSGVLNLTGSSTYAGPTYVQGGTLAVNGSITSPVFLTSGATLGGNGTTGAVTVVPGGAVSPGNSIGTLHVAGNVSFAAGSAYRVEANAAGQSDRLLVSGRVTINGGTVEVKAEQGNYAGRTAYSILTASGGVSGRFSNVTTNLAFLMPVLTYRPNEVNLALIRNGRPMGSVALTPNELATANALEALGGNSRLFDLVLGQSEIGARAAFSALAGNVYGVLAGALLERNAIALAEPPVSRPAAVRFWSQARDGDGHAVSALRSGVSATPYLDLDYGLAIPAGALRLSIGGGQRAARTLVDAPGEQATVATTFLGVRATYTDGGLTADLGVTYGIHSIDASHTVEFPGLAEATRAEAKARTLIADGQLAYRVSLAGLELQPYARASLIRLATDEFRETGGLSSLTLLAQRDTIAQSFLGLRASAQIRLFGSLRVTPRLDAAWQHGWAGLSGERRLLFAGAADAFTVSNALAPRDSLKLNAGADIALGALRLSATYQENVGALWSDRSGRVTATLHF